MLDSTKNSEDAQTATPQRVQKPLTLQQAAGIAGVSPDTVARWCKRYGIGKQLTPEEKSALRAAAMRRGLTLSEYIREAASQASQRAAA